MVMLTDMIKRNYHLPEIKRFNVKFFSLGLDIIFANVLKTIFEVKNWNLNLELQVHPVLRVQISVTAIYLNIYTVIYNNIHEMSFSMSHILNARNINLKGSLDHNSSLFK